MQTGRYESLAAWGSALAIVALLACSGGEGAGLADAADDVVDEVDPGDDADLSTLEPPCGTDRVRDDIGIPTLDGYELSAFVDRPVDQPGGGDCALPTILVQTPYDKESAWRGFFDDDRAERPLFSSPFYNYVVVDWRGRFGSSGLPHAGEGPWLAQDSYDTVEWIAAQPWSDGVVGTWGVSALCGAQYRTAAGPTPTALNPDFADGPPPPLAAMVPIFCAIRSSYGQVYPGGVLRHEWAWGLDVLGFGLRALYENNPRRTLLWDLFDGSNPTERMQVPALVVAGWWDLLPSQTIDGFRELVAESDPSVRAEHRLLIGPWIHFATGGATTEGALRPLTEQERGFMDLDRVIDERSLAFFDHHLRGVANDVRDWEPVHYFHHEGLSAGEWRDAADWPPPGVETRSLYLYADGRLDAAEPTGGSIGSRSFVADPADPSPTLGGSTLSPYNCVGDPNPLLCSLTPDDANRLLHGPTSQAPLLDRDDHLLFTTDTLEEPLELLGGITLAVDVSTTGLDADVAVRLLDVDETGEPWLIGDGIQRLTARVDERTWSEVEPGERYTVEVHLLNDLAYSVPTGHRLGVMVSGSSWPLFARNPQDGAVFVADDVAAGTREAFRYGVPQVELDLQGQPTEATHTLYLDGATRLVVGEAR